MVFFVPGTISVVDGTVYAVAFFIFTSASLLQHESFKILAALRTDVKGKKFTLLLYYFTIYIKQYFVNQTDKIRTK